MSRLSVKLTLDFTCLCTNVMRSDVDMFFLFVCMAYTFMPSVSAASLMRESSRKHDVSSGSYVSCVILQVFGANIPFTRGRYMYGTGIISVIGTSFTFLNVSAASIGNMMVRHIVLLPANISVQSLTAVDDTKDACCQIEIDLCSIVLLCSQPPLVLQAKLPCQQTCSCMSLSC